MSRRGLHPQTSTGHKMTQASVQRPRKRPKPVCNGSNTVCSKIPLKTVTQTTWTENPAASAPECSFSFKHKLRFCPGCKWPRGTRKMTPSSVNSLSAGALQSSRDTSCAPRTATRALQLKCAHSQAAVSGASHEVSADEARARKRAEIEKKVEAARAAQRSKDAGKN